MVKLEVAVSQQELQRLLATFNVTEAACKRAARRAVNKCAKWTEGQAQRAISKELRVARKIVKSRLRLYSKGDALARKVWLGLNKVAAHQFGRVRVNGRGVSVAGRQFDGAFQIKRQPFGGGIYRRTGADRFPLELVKIPIDDEGNRALRQAARAAEERLQVLLRQELNYEFQKVLGNVR